MTAAFLWDKAQDKACESYEQSSLRWRKWTMEQTSLLLFPTPVAYPWQSSDLAEMPRKATQDFPIASAIVWKVLTQ